MTGGQRITRAHACGHCHAACFCARTRVCFRIGAGLETVQPDSMCAGCLLHGVSRIQARISGAIAAQKFVAAILGWASWLRTLENHVALAWCGNKRRQKARKEALPLPLYVVAAFEQAVLQEPSTGSEHARDARLLTAFFLMLWGALRCSDLQRALVSDLCCEDGVVRGARWRTKSSASGMPFSVLTLAIIGNWTHRAQELINSMKECDFLIAEPQGFRASFSYALGHLRRLLIHVSGAPANVAAAYAVHSLKATPLSWALQLEVASDARRAWGHHRAKKPEPATVAKYSRDDVLPALRAQFHVMKAARAGWTRCAVRR